MRRLRAVLAKVLQVDPGSITDETSPANTPSWDSLNALMLLSALEEAFSVSFTMEEAMSVRHVGDIKRALARHAVTLEGDG